MARFHSLTVLSQPPEKTLLPSAFQAEHKTGWSCECAAFGVDVPLGWISQQRTCHDQASVVTRVASSSQYSDFTVCNVTWLSQDVATRRFAVGLKLRLDMPSSGGAVTSTSLFGLWLGGAGCAPKLPNDAIAQDAKATET